MCSVHVIAISDKKTHLFLGYVSFCLSRSHFIRLCFVFAFTFARSHVVCRKKPYQYLSMEKRVVPPDNAVAEQFKAASPRNSSSASNHDSSGQNNKAESSSTSTSGDGSGSDSDGKGSSHSSERPYVGELYQSASELLTEDAVRQHNAGCEPMNSRERIKFWRISEEFAEIEDDFNEQTNFSKPIRSERVSQRPSLFLWKHTHSKTFHFFLRFKSECTRQQR